MLATVVYAHNPFRPSRNRKVVQIRRRRRIDKLAPKTEQPFICLLNGAPLLRKNKGWQRSLKDGDTLAFITLPQGGGGGSNPLKIILAITIAIAAPYLGQMIAQGMMGAGFGLGAFGSTFAMGEFIGAAVGFGLKMMVNALIPDPSPSASQRSMKSLQAASPTYNLAGQGNQARIGQPIPVMYGRNMIYPDFGAQPYTEYAGNEQYLYQLFVVGQGEYDIEQIRLEDTVIESSAIEDGGIYDATGAFEEIQYQICYNQNVTLYPSNVINSVEVTGQEGDCVSGTYSQSLTVITITRNGHGFVVGQSKYLNFTSGTAPDGFYTIDTVPNADAFTVSAASATTSGNVAIGDVIGPFVANTAGTDTNAIGFDIVLPRGLYYANDNGGLDTRSIDFVAQVREVDDLGAPVGSWGTVVNGSISKATTTPQRFSYRAAVAAGRYEARFARTSVKDTDTRTGNDIAWAGLRSYMPGSQNYGSITVLALKMRASNQLSAQSSRRINVVATRKLSTWDGSTWSSAVATRNPAWAIADICTASYGMQLSTSRVDPDGLLSLATTLASRGDNFDAIYDAQQPCWESLSQIARCGRALPYIQGGAVYISRDSAAVTPVAMFTMRNIIKNTFKLSYLFPNEETADAVDIEYWDNGTFQPKQVRAALPGSTESTVAKRQLFGCSDRNHAWREGMYMAAANRYRRRMLSFQTEMEGFIPSVGDLIAVQHDMPQWGMSGELTDWDAVNQIATLSEPVTFGVGTHYMALRKRDGAAADPIVVTPGIDSYHVVFAIDPSITPDVGVDRERTHFAFGLAETLYVEAKVLGIKPRSLERVEISAVVESDAVHTADTGTPPGESAWQLETRITVPEIAGLMARSDPAAAEKMFLSWQPAAGADHYLIEVSDSGNGWTRVGETSVANYTTAAPYGARTQVRVAGVGAVRGPWVEINYGSSAAYMYSGTDSNLMWDVDDTVSMWRY